MLRSFFTGLILFIGQVAVSQQVSLFSNFPATLSQGSSAIVDLKVVKGGQSGFAKYQVDVPEGITISEIESKGGNFTFENNRAKVVWVNMPSEAEFSIKFKVAAGGSAPDKAYINQKFSYLEGGAKKEVVVEPVTIEVGGMGSLAGSKKYTQTAPVTETVASKFDDPKAAESTKPEAAPKDTKPKKEAITETQKEPAKPSQPEPVSTPQPVAEPKKETRPAPKTEPKGVTTTEAVAASNSSPDGLIFRIQFAASPADPGVAKYAALGKGVESLKEDGLYKVVYGHYASKEEALKALEECAAKGFKGFLVKYQNGKRVK